MAASSRLKAMWLCIILATTLLNGNVYGRESDCGENQFECATTDGWCIPISWVCDAIIDCLHNEDEMICCTDEEYNCANGRCIDREQLCNGVNDCGDSSDEITCQGTTVSPTSFTTRDNVPTTDDDTITTGITSLPTSFTTLGSVPTTDGVTLTTGTPCFGNQYFCRVSGICIPHTWECDDFYDCPFGEDEISCCDSHEYNCANGNCISPHLVCNGENDCMDNSDEDRCQGTTASPTSFTTLDHVITTDDVAITEITSLPTSFTTLESVPTTDDVTLTTDVYLCQNGLQVLSPSMRCNDLDECSDGSDEEFCDCGDSEIQLTAEVTAYIMSPYHPFNYGENIDCTWRVLALEGQWVYATFVEFILQRADYLYIGQEGSMHEALRYTGERIPPDIVSQNGVLVITFETDFNNTDRGFSIEMSSTNETDISLCENGLEVLPPNGTCDGILHCYDLSDEQICPPCEMIPVEICRNLLPYNFTRYTDSIAQSRRHALEIFEGKYENVSMCHANATLLFCYRLFPSCSNNDQAWMPCQSLCETVKTNCLEIHDFGECDGLPDENIESGNTACSFKEGDLFGSGICGTRPALNPNQRIFGGDDAIHGSWPWICSLQSQEQLYYGHYCGGSLINNEWVVTAAHCVDGNPADVSYFKVVCGINNAITLEPSVDREERTIAQVIMHPDREYVDLFARITTNDIALLKLSSPIEYTNYIRPVCLATHQHETDKYTNCWTAGWGWTEYTHDTDLLQDVAIPLISSERCRSAEFAYGPKITDDMICSGSLPGIANCRGDSGGPYVCQDEYDNWNLVGIVSWGSSSCEDVTRPNVYVRVSMALDFIESNVLGFNETDLCRSDQFQCGSGECLESLWSQCDFNRECYDGSDESGCPYCPMEHIHLSVTSSIVIQSVGYPSNYVNDLWCEWRTIPVVNRRVQVEFTDFSLEDEYDNLFIGIESNRRALQYSGSVLPHLRVLSPVNESLIFEFITDGSVTERGFSLILSDAHDGEYTLCSNDLEVLNESSICNDVEECSDDSDEEFCECEDLVRQLYYNSTIYLTSNNYPNNYDMETSCRWEIQAPSNARVHVVFRDFSLARYEDYLYVGPTTNKYSAVRYTGNKLQPPEIVSRDRRLYIFFETDSWYVDRGFQVEMMVYNETLVFDRGLEFCGNGLEIIPGDSFCDENIDCYDSSDELECVQECDILPHANCSRLLQYHATYFPGPVAESATDAASWLANFTQVFGCHPKAELFMCSLLYPSCPINGTSTVICRSLCKAIESSCSDDFVEFDVDWSVCNTYPDDRTDLCYIYNDTRFACDLYAEYRCKGSGYCIPHYYECDKTIHCTDRTDELYCPCTGTDSFQCSSGECIHDHDECDRRVECEDASDEKNCPCGTPTYFRCESEECIYSSDVCDHSMDCLDGSDERNCSCDRPLGFLCNSGECVSTINDRCDYIEHCEDGSDEVNCTCLPFEFECDNGECVYEWGICDRYFDCADHSDEIGCDCPSYYFVCESGECISSYDVCDHSIDCLDGSDERNCPCEAPVDFRCESGECIYLADVCDFNVECPDGSDERNCSCDRPLGFLCSSGECVSTIDDRCDYIEHCEDGSDEDNCTCPSYQFQCDNGECIYKSDVCDRRPECSDHSDEIGCICPSSYFLCGSGECIYSSDVCDHRIECLDGSDERNCPCYGSSDFRCESGECIYLSDVCDFDVECTDGSDERNCSCDRPRGFLCDSGECASAIDDRCDNIEHCDDGSDEINCKCSSYYFQCDNGECISKYDVCDNRPECSDHSDEIGCDCSPSDFICESGECLYSHDECDHSIECLDGSDERNCSCDRPSDFLCGSGECVSAIDDRCNGIEDCEDGSDELDCICHSSNQYQCDNGQCVSVWDVCDRRPDCSDHSDEIGCTCDRPNEFLCGSGECLFITETCDGFPHCLDYTDETNCTHDCGYEDEIVVNDHSVVDLRSSNYPSAYNSSLFCLWKIQAQQNQRVHVTFKDFALAPYLDYLYINVERNHRTALRYTGQYRQPPDIVSPSDILYIFFKSDWEFADRGFWLQLKIFNETSVNDTVEPCDNNLEMLPAERSCDDIIDCSDGSDELCTFECEAIPATNCTSLLPYNATYYPGPVADSEEDAAFWLTNFTSLLHCHPKADLFLCSLLYPSCPINGTTSVLCRDLCAAVKESCDDVFTEFDIDWSICESYPNNTDDEFCQLKQETNIKRCDLYSQFQCVESGKCIPHYYQCDHFPQCLDGSDEIACPCEGPGAFQCSSTECISRYQRCNGRPDCTDDIDERHCANCGNNGTMFIDIGESHTLEYLNYPNNAYCQWNFNVSDGRYIRVHFQTFHLETWFDVLYFGFYDNFFEFGPYTGYNNPAEFTSMNTLWITFTSDESITDTGFVLVLSDTDEPLSATHPPAPTTSYALECFLCSTGECIPYYWVCDGETDCDLGEDETACPSYYGYYG